MPSLLAFARVPNQEAIALSPTIGWLSCFCLLAFLTFIYAQADTVRKLWMRIEDPRSMGLFRICFAMVVIFNVNGLWEDLELYLSDEGLFLQESARNVMARGQFRGYGPGEDGGPYSFYDFNALLTFLKGPRFSILFFWDSPTAVWTVFWAFQIFTILFMVGFKSRWTGWISFILFTSILHRNISFWTGADGTIFVYYFLIMLSRSGHAYSVDNWLRCRKLRKKGLLSEKNGPGDGAGLPPSPEHPQGLEAIYRLIPGWPRLLMILQLCVIYAWTGMAKTGSVWAAGDALYYSMNLDHFYRVPTQLLSYFLVGNLFRASTWLVHFWEVSFPILFVSLVLRWKIREEIPLLLGWRKWTSRLSLWAVWIGATLITIVALPVHYSPEPGYLSMLHAQIAVAAGALAIALIFQYLWPRLRDRPFQIRIRNLHFSIGLEGVFTWIFGRRLILYLGLTFHAVILFLMNIGMFAPIMIAAYIICLNGTEVAMLGRDIGHRLGRWGIPGFRSIPTGESIVPGQLRTLPSLHRAQIVVPNGTWILLSLSLLSSILLRSFDLPYWSSPCLMAILFTLIQGTVNGVKASKQNNVDTNTGRDAVAYGPFGRSFIGLFIAFHLLAWGIWCIPAKDSTKKFRKSARKSVALYMNVSQFRQSWNMFAPNPTRSNAFLYTTVTDMEGQQWDVHTNVHSPDTKVMPWFNYRRSGKFTRRMMGKGNWKKYYSRYWCRAWALDHNGEMPKEVKLEKHWYRIPPRKKLQKMGPYHPVDYIKKAGKIKEVHVEKCKRHWSSQLPNEIRERYDLPEIPEKKVRKPSNKSKFRKWERKQAKARGEVVEPKSSLKKDGKTKKDAPLPQLKAKKIERARLNQQIKVRAVDR